MGGGSILPDWITYLLQIRDYRSCQRPNVALAMRKAPLIRSRISDKLPVIIQYLII